MSTQKGNQKKTGQKYQNSRKFTVTFNETYKKQTSNAPLDRLCEQCKAQIEWKIQFGKYKPPTAIGRCCKCEGKSVFKAYRKICDPCADDLMVCTKCMEEREEGEDDQDPLNKQDIREKEEFIRGLRERSRRTVERKLNNELISWSKEQKCFIDNETGKQLEGLQFKKAFLDEEDEELWGDLDEEDDDDFEGAEDEDEEEEEEQKKQQEKPKEIAKKKQPDVKQKQTKLHQQIDSDEEFKQKKSDTESSGYEDNSDMYCQDEYSDGSCDLDKWNRTQKNFKYYFAIEDYPTEEDIEN